MMFMYQQNTFVEAGLKPQPNGWILHIPSCYLGIAQAARDYAVHFAENYSPNSIEGIIADLLLSNKI